MTEMRWEVATGPITGERLVELDRLMHEDNARWAAALQSPNPMPRSWCGFYETPECGDGVRCLIHRWVDKAVAAARTDARD